MAPSPENDNSPKAPDKSEKSDKCVNNDIAKENDKDAKTLSNLNDEELKALLDEAINYKNPKDKEGKSKLFKNLLSKAVEDERKNRATSAGGSELVRYYNTTAKRNGGRHGRRKPSSSVSENVMHGGSLDNLAKEELYETDRRYRTKKNVSARQREGGSLPCNVNSSMPCTGTELEFLKEARRKKALHRDFSGAVDDVAESVSLLEDDSLAKTYQDNELEQPTVELVMPSNPLPTPAKYTSKATLQVSNVDDAIQLPELDGHHDKKTYDLETLQTKVLHSKYSVYIPTYRMVEEPKKVDENGNALQQNPGTKTKKKKSDKSDKNVVVLNSENVEGHRGDIINDIPKLVEYIGGGPAEKNKSNTHKSKQLHKQHASDDGSGRTKKQRAHSTKGKEARSDLKKSNSLGEISTANLGEFDFSGDGKGDPKVILRSNKSHNVDRPRERRSWGTVEPHPFSGLSNSTSTEQLENSDNWIETKTKKKSKKRRNSMSSSSRRQNTGMESCARHSHNRAPSPDLRGGKMACSVPHSEKSNDSSDVDSVHSLPIDGLNAPISYADIAKNSEKMKDKKQTPEKLEKVPNKEKSPSSTKVINAELTDYIDAKSNSSNKSLVSGTVPEKLSPILGTGSGNVVKNTPPDVTNFKSFPAITTNNKVVNMGVQVNSVASPTDRANNVKNLVGNKIKSNPPTNNKCVKNLKNVGVMIQNSHQNDINIQNDLTIIQANEKENIQFNAQRLPPNILDVSSIEKRFLNHHTSPINTQHQDTAAACSGAASPISIGNNSSLTLSESPSSSSMLALSGNNICDSAVVDDAANRTTTVECESPPPVVILSGVNNKEVSGLVFGFDINEQLLSEDVCESFVSRFVCPKFDRNSHDKIVNFIGFSWDSVINQSNEPVSYYVDGL